MNQTYDAIVVGCGGIGSATIYSLASRGLKVLGIDKFSPPHSNGSSHGHTRAIRKAYFEHPSYVPLLESSYELWSALEQTTNKELLHLVGVIEIGPPDGILINGVRTSAELHGLPVEFLSTKDAVSSFPGLYLTDELEVAFERDAGYLLVEECIETFLTLAKSLGAVIQTETSVLDWNASSSGVTVNTSSGKVEAGALALCSGPWSSSLLGNISDIKLELRKKHMYWYSNENKNYLASSGFPVFALELPSSDQGRVYYGFPQIDSSGVKLAEHSGGITVDSPTCIKDKHDPEFENTKQFRHRYLPNITGELSRHETCLYTVSHDENFYIDNHPEHRNVAYVAGLSGHGFKFAPVLGEILADLATCKEPGYKADFLKPGIHR